MKTHDIVCDAEGWSYLVNGVRTASYPSWFMALNAARHAAERDVLEGISTALRYQGPDGKMHPVQTRGTRHAPSSVLAQRRLPITEKRSSQQPDA